MAAESPPDLHEHRPWSMPMEGARRAAFERFHGPSRWPSWMFDAARAREQPAVPGHNTADEAQLGGSIVVTPGGRVAFAHISRDASDVASPAEIFAAIEPIQFGPDGWVNKKREQADQATGLA